MHSHLKTDREEEGTFQILHERRTHYFPFKSSLYFLPICLTLFTILIFYEP